MNRTLKRIVNDIALFERMSPENMYIKYDRSNLMKIHGMIIGEKDTPYAYGYYFFEIVFPDNYPLTSPKVLFLTTNGKVRFNPNLYENGKVCLSILGTWAGPGWRPIMNLMTLMKDLQLLLHDNPIINEPGHEKKKKTDKESIIYNRYLSYWTIELGILGVIKDDKFKYLRELFLEEIKGSYEKNLAEIVNNINLYMKDKPLSCCTYIYFQRDKGNVYNYDGKIEEVEEAYKLLNKK